GRPAWTVTAALGGGCSAPSAVQADAARVSTQAIEPRDQAHGGRQRHASSISDLGFRTNVTSGQRLGFVVGRRALGREDNPQPGPLEGPCRDDTLGLVNDGDPPMSLDGFDHLAQLADARTQPVSLSVAGGDDPTVLEAFRTAIDRGWVRPILVGPASRIESLAGSLGIPLDGITIHHAEGDAVAEAAVEEVRASHAQMLMKGQIATPALMAAVLNPTTGLRSDRVVCQVVLMEIPRDHRRFLLADTGICVHPDRRKRIDLLHQAVDVAHALGAARPKVALMAATETVKVEMPETIEAAELSRRNRQGEFGDCVIEGPLSFDLAYAVEAGAK